MTREEQWDKNYALASAYFEHYGNLNVTKKFRTINGYVYDKNGIRLGIWISNLRQNYDKLSPLKKEKIKEIGFILSYRNYIWEKNYILAKTYFNHYGNLLVQQIFSTTNGIDFDAKGIKLGIWIATQRQDWDKLSSYRKQKLLEIGFILNPFEQAWEEKYELAEKFHEHYGHLYIPYDFNTLDGYTFNQSGVKIGSWIKNQAIFYDDLPEERKEKLNKKDFKFFLTLPTFPTFCFSKFELCRLFNINININFEIIQALPYNELYAKIMYLTKRNITLFDGVGQLHEIFYMDNIDLMLKYGFSVDELISKYYFDYLNDEDLKMTPKMRENNIMLDEIKGRRKRNFVLGESYFGNSGKRLILERKTK